MARKTVLLPSLSRVTASATATLECPKGPTYHRIIFSAAGTALEIADIGRISVYLDGKLVQTYKNLQRLMDINGYYNRGADTVNQFALHFFRAEMFDAVYRRAPGIGTADVQTFHIEIELAAGTPADITMTAHAEVNPAPENLGAFLKVREYPFSSAVSGQVEIDKLPRGAWYAGIHLFKADVSAVEVVVDQTKVIEATKSVLERTQEEASPFQRIPVTASATHIDFVTEGDLAQALNTAAVQDFRVKATLDTSGAVDIVTETLDTLQGA
jgi:hypothetical protein